MVLTLQQPLIKDLRFVIGTLQIVLHLEKITEHYTSTTNLLSDINLLETLIKDNVAKMLSTSNELLKISLTLYLSFNLELANKSDVLLSEINYFHNITYKQILNEVSKEQGQKAQVEAQLISIIRSAEKISDSAISIIEQVNYIILGNSK